MSPRNTATGQLPTRIGVHNPIIHAGIRAVVFTEPYPDIRAAHRMELAGISFERFEGVRSWRFDEIFGRARPYAESRQ